MTVKSGQPFVSVIIPVYNRYDFVRRAIDSVLSQTYRNFELIVVDDGSTDDTSRVKSDYGDRIRYVRHPDNRGVAAARNTGIREAAGEWIALLDSDDWWLPEKLEEQINYLLDHPQFPIAQTEEIWIRNGRRVNPRKIHEKEEGYIFPRSLQLCLISPSAVIIKRELLDEVGLFDESLPAAEDYDLWLRITYKYEVGLLRKPLIVKIGGHPDQLSRTTPVIDRYRIEAIRKILRAGVLDTEQRKLAIEELTKKCRIVKNGALKRDNRELLDFCEEISGEFSLKI